MTEERIQELKEKIVKDGLGELDTSTLISMYNDYADEYIFDDLEELIDNLNLSAYEAVQKFNFGDCNFSDDYWTLDGYANFKSYSKYDIDTDLIDELEYHLTDIVDDYADEFDFSAVEDAEDMQKDVDHYKQVEDYIKADFNDFVSKNCMFAFSEEQFKDGLEKLNRKETDLVSIGYGGYTKAEHVEAYKNILKAMDYERIEAKKDESYLVGMFYYEMCNHEYGYTRDLTDTFIACGVSAESLEKDEKLKAAFEKAQDVYLKIDDIINS